MRSILKWIEQNYVIVILSILVAIAPFVGALMGKYSMRTSTNMNTEIKKENKTMGSKHYTLEDIKNHVPSCEVLNEIQRTWQLSMYNRGVYRYRMDNDDVKSCIFDLTHDGNDPKDNNRLLDFAACYYQAKVYTDEEWERYFLPAINEMIAKNDSFVRWLPGYVIRRKKDGSKAIVEYDYATGFGGRDFTSLALTNIEDDGSLGTTWAWASYNDYELVDTEHTEENIARIREKNIRNKSQPPYFLKEDIVRLLY